MSGDARYLSALHAWIQDWCRYNPPNTGPNWMCGQETSIRLINVLLAFRISGLKDSFHPTLVPFVKAHCRRVNLTTFYAVAQDNNHGTSEAAALFVGGTWLAKYATGSARHYGEKCAQKGRRLLETLVHRLILDDGSFSQHSLTYHRVLLDTLSIAEVWRRDMDDNAFSKDFHSRAAAATRWLAAVIDPTSGDGPNLGANDGAQPYKLDSSSYRDFRPSLQLAAVLFTAGPALKPGPWDEPAAWLGVSAEQGVRPWLNDLSSAVFPDGEYVVMRNRTGARMLLRTPTARFRPPHADALHLDLWWKGKNLLRDSGTYSYADGDLIGEALASVAGHNAPQFDGHDQMPRLSHFLYGAWLRISGMSAIATSADEQSWAGIYTDAWRARHRRTVRLGCSTLSVLDELSGFKQNAVLRWHLAPLDWRRTEAGCASEVARIQVHSTVPVRRMSLESGCESRHYLEKSTVPVLEVEIDQSPAVLTTTIVLG